MSQGIATVDETHAPLTKIQSILEDEFVAGRDERGALDINGNPINDKIERARDKINQAIIQHNSYKEGLQTNG